MTDPSFSVAAALTPALAGGDDSGDQEGLEAALMVLDEYISSGMSDDGDDDACVDASSAQRGRRSLSRSSSSRLGVEQPGSPADASQRRARSKSVGAPKKAITWDPNRARNERKGELIFLRKRVAQLEAKLQRLQGKVSAAAPSGRIHDASSQQSSSLPAASLIASPSSPALLSPAVAAAASSYTMESLALWESISHRQCQERLKSERENIRLKLALERQLKIAKTLDKIVHKKAVIKELERAVLETASDTDAKPISTIASGASSTAFASGAGSTSLDLSTLLLLEMHESMEELTDE